MAERCPSCAGEVGAAQRFCQECGTRLTARDAGEHKVVTAVFGDIVESISLAEQIGAEGAVRSIAAPAYLERARERVSTLSTPAGRR